MPSIPDPELRAGGSNNGAYTLPNHHRFLCKMDISDNSVKINPYTSSGALSIAFAFLFLPTMALGRPDPTPFTSSLSGEHGLEPAPLPLLVFLVSSFFGN